MTNEHAPKLAAIIDRDRAPAILCMLVSDEVRGRLNDRLIAELLDSVALSGSSVTIRAVLRRVEEAGLIELKPVDGHDLIIAELTKRGFEVAQDRAWVDGISLHPANNPY